MLQILKASLLCRSAIVNAADCIEVMLVLIVVSIFCKYYRPPQQQLGADQRPCYNKCSFIYMFFWSFAHVYKNSTKYYTQNITKITKLQNYKILLANKLPSKAGSIERRPKFSKSGTKFFLVYFAKYCKFQRLALPDKLSQRIRSWHGCVTPC